MFAIGHVSEYDGGNLNGYIERLEQYFVANGI